MTSKIFRDMGFGEIIEWAEKLGWKDPNLLTNGEWTSDDCDATELAAMEYIVSHRFKKALIEFVIDHLKHFKCYPMEFEYGNKVYNYKEIMEILKKRKD